MPAIELDSREGRLEALRTMLRIRAFENQVQERFADNEIPGFVHLSQGQEAVAVGTCGALEESDYITSTHRAHGHCIAHGLDPERLMAELYGTEAGYCKGRGGSMHVEDREQGLLGAQPIVGESIPLAVGAGITAQFESADWIAVGFTGDGAVAAGQVHEAINLAAVWDLPVVFVVENNLYSEGMVFEEQHNVDDLAEMGAAYGIPGEIVDGQDVGAVYEAVSSARDRASSGEGPTLIEAKTYRYRGHFEGDDEPYRSDAEVEQWKTERDPIENFKTELIAAGDLDADGFRARREDARRTIAEAVRFARDGDQPAPEAAYEGVFVESVPEIARFRDRLGTDGGRGDAG
jgi:TPP-dependent pyruvate/acetoin dehydrogenase alpha subunit